MRGDDDATAGETGTNRAADHTKPTMKPQTRTSGAQGDKRAVSEVIGAILIFGLVLAVLALIQVSAVPAANQQIEYEHSQRIEGDFQQLDNGIERAAFDGSRGTTPLELGTRYPVRLFLLNPGPVSGDIRTSPEELQLSGFRATNEETAQYLRGDLTFKTRSVSYRANYNEYGSAPRIGYEGGILYERYDEEAGGRDVLVDRGAVVSGSRITIVTLGGNLSTQQVDELSLDTIPASTSTGTVSVSSPSEPSITVRTSLSEQTWRDDILDTELDGSGNLENDRYVESIDCPGESDPSEPCDGELVITFESGQTYDLRMAKVGLGSAKPERSEYLTTVSDATPEIVLGQSQQLTVEVRDRYNNPVSGVPVRFSTRTEPVVSEEDGRATVTYSPSSTGSETVTANIDPNTDEKHRVTFTVEGVPPSGGTGEPDRLQDINPRTEDIELQSATLEGSSTLVVTFRNTNENSDRQIRQGRIPFVLATGEPDSATLSGTNTAGQATTFGQLLVTDQLRDVGPITVPAGETRTVRFAFDDILEQSGGSGNFDAFFVFTASVTDTAGANARPHTFFISDELGVDPFTATDASDVQDGQTAATQTFTFTPQYDMASGQTVTIDLGSAQGVTAAGEPAPVDYQGASVTTAASTLQGGSATISATDDDTELTYTVGNSGLDAGEQVTVQADGIATQDSSTTVENVEFTWSFAGSEVTSFQVR